MVRIPVTPEQVHAAPIEVAAFRSAGIEHELDPLVVKLANVELDDDRPTDQGADDVQERP